jgi:predicted regulator of Ras-like GTPase activity (Roadblock/LC7/MglB family)
MAIRYAELLEEFIRDSGAEGAVLVSVDGLAIASVLPSTADEDRVAAMGTAILSLGERVTSELKKVNLE